MKYYLKTIYPLIVIAVFFGLLLSLTYQWLSPKIKAAQAEEERKALNYVMPNADNYISNMIDETVYYTATKQSGDTNGFIFKVGEIGYGGPVLTLVGINLEQEVENIFVLSADQETPGLGYKCTSLAWQNQFVGLDEEEVPSNKAEFEQQNLEAITGATITSVAVADNISIAFDLFHQVYTPPTTISTNGGMTNGTNRNE